MIFHMLKTRSVTTRHYLSVAALTLVFLSGCGGETTATLCTQQYWNGTVGVCLPNGWKVVEREQMEQRGIPPEVVAAFQTEKPLSGQYPTVVVTEEVLAQPMGSTDYSKANVQAISALPGYENIDQRTVTVDAKEVTLDIYTAQPEASQPKQRFYQLSAVSQSGTGYTVTASTPFAATTGLDKQVVAITSSFTTEEPEKK